MAVSAASLTRLARAAEPTARNGASASPRTVLLKLGCQEGPTTDERLRFFARHGVRHICASFGRRPQGPYTVSELGEMRDRAAGQGIRVELVRLPFLRPSMADRDGRSAIVLGRSPDRDRDIDEVVTTLANCARVGIPGVTYNLSILGYQRSHKVTGRGGSQATAWRLADPGAKKSGPALAAQVPADLFWERIAYFLDRVVPAANEHRVRIACHPHDPPTPPSWRGVDAVLGTVEGLKRFVGIRESRYHGLNFCQGTVAEMLQDPAKEIFDVIRWFGTRGKIFNVHFRNIRGRRDDFVETQPDEGDIDMVKAARVYHEVGYDGMLMPDHVTKHADDRDERQAYAFAYGYIRGVIQALGGRG